MPYAFAKRHTIFATLTKVILVLAFLTEIVALLLPLKLINQIQLILTMSLINANQISMVTIDNLIITAIKDIHNKKQRTKLYHQMLLLIKPEMILYNLK